MTKKDKKGKEVTINYYGTEVFVSEEVREILMRDFWREKKRKERSTRCIIEGGKRCDKPCSQCMRTRDGGDFSIEVMKEIGMEIPSQESVEDTVIKEERNKVIFAEFDKMDKVDQAIMILLSEGNSDRKIAESLGMPQTTVSYRKRKVQKYFKENFADLL